MNYCAEWGRPTLSTLDLVGLRSVYGVSPFEFRFTVAVTTDECTSVDEPADPYTWDDNYLCY